MGNRKKYVKQLLKDKMDKDGLENEIMKGHEEFGGDWFFFLTVVMIL